MKILVTGGAGFIGSHVCDRLVERGDEVHALDNLSLGRKDHIAHHLSQAGKPVPPVERPTFRFFEADLLDFEALRATFSDGRYDAVFHMAANSDVQRSVAETDLDLHQTFLTTWHVLDCARQFGVPEILFPSSSTVYGPRDEPIAEDSGPLFPVSLYGAAKLAAEGFLSAYAALYDLRVWIFRLPNVVGPRMTHGCVFDFMQRLRADPSRLRVLGDGRQSKPYVYVDDLLDAMFLAWERSREPVNYFNVGVEDKVSVRRIAEIVIEAMGLRDVQIEYTGGKRGWPGDVPTYQYDFGKIHALGWKARFSSAEAVRRAVRMSLTTRMKAKG